MMLSELNNDCMHGMHVCTAVSAQCACKSAPPALQQLGTSVLQAVLQGSSRFGHVGVFWASASAMPVTDTMATLAGPSHRADPEGSDRPQLTAHSLSSMICCALGPWMSCAPLLSAILPSGRATALLEAGSRCLAT